LKILSTFAFKALAIHSNCARLPSVVQRVPRNANGKQHRKQQAMKTENKTATDKLNSALKVEMAQFNSDLDRLRKMPPVKYPGWLWKTK